MEDHPEARHIVETLVQAGYEAYYAGGWVRDYLLKHPSDDIDIATNASPETIQKLFDHTVPIGIAFGIVLVIIEGKQYEVATFRQDLDYRDGRRPSSILFTSAKEDAKRRDFTINGMFYDPLKEELLDYVEGQEDLKAKVIRAIGDPDARFREDRLRMVRAARLSCRFGFAIEKNTEAAIRAHSKELCVCVAIERICQELSKALQFHTFSCMVLKLHELMLLETIFPAMRGVSDAELKRRILPLGQYPKTAPLIAWILPLLEPLTLAEQVELCRHLKRPNFEKQFVLFLFHVRTLLKEHPRERAPWAHVYAHPLSLCVLQILAAHETHSLEFLQKHEQREMILRPWVERIQKQTPLITAQDLMQEGILPGPHMGRLLACAETLSINEGILDKKLVLRKLRQTSHWVQ